MAELRQKLRGTTLQLDQYIGSEGQILVDTQTWEIRVYDGVLLGGYRIPTLATAMEAFQLPDRLKPTGKEFTANLNDAIEAGFYRTTATTTNQPDDTKIGFVLVEPGDAGRVKQTWTDSTGELTYTRVFDGGATWSAWLRVVDMTLGDERYLGIAAKAADSELLDGQEGSWYSNIVARLGYTPANKAGDTFTGTVSIQNAAPVFAFIDETGSMADAAFALEDGTFRLRFDTDSNGSFETVGLGLTPGTSSGTLFGGAIWTSLNDGPGSTLDADTVDTIHASQFARVDTRPNFAGGGDMPSMATATVSLGEFMVYANGGSNTAAFAFHNNAFAIYFGLDTDNKLKRGGWSLGANAYEIWDAGNQPVATGNVASTLMKRDGSGDVHARLYRSEYNSAGGTLNYMMGQTNFTTDNYIRPFTLAQVVAALPAASDSTQGMLSAALATFLGAPAAGAVFCKKLQEQNYNLISSNFTRATLAVEVAGTIRITGTHRGGSGQVSTVTIYKNGTSVQSWSDSSGSFQNRTIDIAVAVGDVIRWHAGTNADPDWGPVNNWQISADAYRHIGSMTVFPAGM